MHFRHFKSSGSKKYMFNNTNEITNQFNPHNMKRTLLLLMLGFLITTQATAQDNELRKKYINVGFSTIERTQDDFPSLKSNFGAAFTVGRTYFVHKEPIARMIRFGIDATWFDINYTNYKIEYRYQEQQKYESETVSLHQAEIGIQAGPSITINPLSKLNIHGYFRYAPSYSALYGDQSIQGGFASYFVGGGAVSYGVIGLGIEARFGGTSYKPFGLGQGEEEDDRDDPDASSATLKSKFSGMRIYLTFRF